MANSAWFNMFTSLRKYAWQTYNHVCRTTTKDCAISIVHYHYLFYNCCSYDELEWIAGGRNVAARTTDVVQKTFWEFIKPNHDDLIRLSELYWKIRTNAVDYLLASLNIRIMTIWSVFKRVLENRNTRGRFSTCLLNMDNIELKTWTSLDLTVIGIWY